MVGKEMQMSDIETLVCVYDTYTILIAFYWSCVCKWTESN